MNPNNSVTRLESQAPFLQNGMPVLLGALNQVHEGIDHNVELFGKFLSTGIESMISDLSFDCKVSVFSSWAASYHGSFML